MRGPGRLDVKEVPINALERAVRNPYNLRVGATNDPLARARQYEQGIRGHVVVGQFIYSRVWNARRAEDHLLRVTRGFRQAGHPHGRLNVQWTSNYSDMPGYVYVILGRILPRNHYGQVIYSQPQCCVIM